MITIKDIAREAGVSVSTVSNALNDLEKVTPETRERIRTLAQAMGYVPNLNARRLKNRLSHNIGLFLPNFGGDFYVGLVQAMYERCKASGLSLLVHISDSITSQRLSSVILSSNIDGAVILNEHLEDSDLPFLRDRHLPLVFLDKDLAEPNISSVLIDNAQGIGLAVDHLADLGHRRLAFVRGFANFDDVVRLQAFGDALGRRGLDLRADWVLWGLFNAEAAYEAVRQAGWGPGAADRPDAVVCGNDAMAKGCIRALEEAGLRVPDDISVVGFDDSEFASWCRPPLTTVANPVAALGVRAVEELLRLTSDEEEGRRIVLPTELRVRASTRARE